MNSLLIKLKLFADEVIFILNNDGEYDGLEMASVPEKVTISRSETKHEEMMTRRITQTF